VPRLLLRSVPVYEEDSVPYLTRNGVGLHYEQEGDGDPQRLLALKPSTHIGVTVSAGHFLRLEAPE
jgi:hypothetical protein